MIAKLKKLEGKNTIKFYQMTTNYYDEMNIRKLGGLFHFVDNPLC